MRVLLPHLEQLLQAVESNLTHGGTKVGRLPVAWSLGLAKVATFGASLSNVVVLYSVF